MIRVCGYAVKLGDGAFYLDDPERPKLVGTPQEATLYGSMPEALTVGKRFFRVPLIQWVAYDTKG